MCDHNIAAHQFLICFNIISTGLQITTICHLLSAFGTCGDCLRIQSMTLLYTLCMTIKTELLKGIFILASSITINLCHPDRFCPRVYWPRRQAGLLGSAQCPSGHHLLCPGLGGPRHLPRGHQKRTHAGELSRRGGSRKMLKGPTRTE